MDGNTKFGSIETEHVGGWCADEQNLARDCVHHFLLQHALSFPSTCDAKCRARVTKSITLDYMGRRRKEEHMAVAIREHGNTANHPRGELLHGT